MQPHDSTTERRPGSPNRQMVRRAAIELFGDELAANDPRLTEFSDRLYAAGWAAGQRAADERRVRTVYDQGWLVGVHARLDGGAPPEA